MTYIHCIFAVQCLPDMGWLRSVGSLKLWVSFAKEPYKRDYILQKRHVVLRSLLIVATPYSCIVIWRMTIKGCIVHWAKVNDYKGVWLERCVLQCDYKGVCCSVCCGFIVIRLCPMHCRADSREMVESRKSALCSIDSIEYTKSELNMLNIQWTIALTFEKWWNLESQLSVQLIQLSTQNLNWINWKCNEP